MASENSDSIDFASGEVYPLLPLRDIVVFPHMIVPLFVGREKSINALEDVMNKDKKILLFTQKLASDDDPAPEALYEIGTLATVLQMLKLPDGTVKVLVEGVARARVEKYVSGMDYLAAQAQIVEDGQDDEYRAGSRVALGGFGI